MSEDFSLVEIRHLALILLVQELLEITAGHMLEHDVELKFTFLTSCTSLLGSLQEVHCLHYARVVEHPLHFKFLEHVSKFFLREIVVVEDLTLLDDACHGHDEIRCFDFTEEYVTLSTFANLAVVFDEEFLS